MKLEDLPEVKHDDFMCRCSPEERAKSDRVRGSALDFYNERMGGKKYPLSEAAFIDSMLFWLGTEGEVSIIADQRAGVSVSFEPHGSEKYPAKAERSYIQCDSIADGIAATFVLYAKQGLFEMPEGDSAQNDVVAQGIEESWADPE